MENLNVKNSNKDPEKKNPRLLGAIYILFGITGLSFSVIAVVYGLGIIRLYGTVTAGMLIGALSILIIIYGYIVFKKEY